MKNVVPQQASPAGTLLAFATRLRCDCCCLRRWESSPVFRLKMRQVTFATELYKHIAWRIPSNDGGSGGPQEQQVETK